MIGKAFHFAFKLLSLLWTIPFLVFLYFVNSWCLGLGWIYKSVRRLRKALKSSDQINLDYIDPLGHYHPLSFYFTYARDFRCGSGVPWPVFRVIEKDPLQYKHALTWLEKDFKRKTLFWRVVRHLLVSYYRLLATVNSGKNPYTSHFQAIADRFLEVQPNGHGEGFLSFLSMAIQTKLFDNKKYTKQKEAEKRSEELRDLAKKGLTQKLLHELNGGANLESPDDNGWTLLFHAMKGGHYDTVKALVKKGADLNARDILGHTMLSVCARNGYKEKAEFLLSMDAEVNTREEVLGRTPLMIAAYCGHTPLVRLLLKAGADATMRDDQGETALSIAEKHGRDEVVRVLNV